MKKNFFAFTIITALSLPFGAFAATDYLLKLDGVDGETTQSATAELSLVPIGTAVPVVTEGANGVVGKTFVLDATKSQDDGVVRTFTWKQVSGPTTKLSSVLAIKPSFTPTVPGTYVFDLMVTDATGLASVAQRSTFVVASNVPMATTVAASNTVSPSITGDPDFDLLRTSTQPPEKLPPGDPDFDLLRVTPPLAPQKSNVETGWKVEEGTKISPPTGTQKGNVEMNWKVEEGESAALPAVEPDEIDYRDDDDDDDAIPTKDEDISLSAVTVRGWDPKKKEEFLAERKTFAEVKSGQDLENFATGILLDTDGIEEVALKQNEVEVSYEAKGKFLWLIPLSYTERLIASDSGGGVDFKVKKPWWGFLVSANVSPEETATETKDKHKQEIDIESWSWGASNQAHLLHTISNVLKTKHDTVKNSISNVR